MKIPNESEWGDYESDMDAEWAFKKFRGKNKEEATRLIKNNPLECSFDIAAMNRVPFAYYSMVFREYVKEGEFGEMDLNNSYVSYVNLICSVLSTRPEIIKPVISELLPIALQIANNQDEYQIDREIFGDLLENIELAMANGKT